MAENIWVPEPVRFQKLFRLGFLLFRHCLRSFLLRLKPGGLSLNELTSLNQQSAIEVLKCLGVEIRYSEEDPLPQPAFVVANHVSYLDPLILMALTPSIFITSEDVGGSFPINILSHSAGALLFDRQSRSHSARQVTRLRALLRSGVSVTVFPEGTTSDGKELLPFKSALFEAAVRENVPIITLALRYRLRGAIPEEELLQEIVYFLKKHSFVPHVLNFLRLRRLEAHVRRVGSLRSEDRKEVSQAAYCQIQSALSAGIDSESHR